MGHSNKQISESSLSQETKDLKEAIATEYKTVEKKEVDVRKALRREVQRKKKELKRQKEELKRQKEEEKLQNKLLNKQSKAVKELEEETNLLLLEQKERVSSQKIVEEESKKIKARGRKEKESSFKKTREDLTQRRQEEFSKIKDIEKEKEKERVKQQLLLLSQKKVKQQLKTVQQTHSLMDEFLLNDEDDIFNKLKTEKGVNTTNQKYVLIGKSYTFDIDTKKEFPHSQLKLIDDDGKDIHLQLRYTAKKQFVIGEHSGGKWHIYQTLEIRNVTKFLITLKCLSNGNVEITIPSLGNFSIKRKTNKQITKMVWTFDTLKFI